MSNYKAVTSCEFQNLPNGSVVLDKDGEAWQKSHVGYWRTVGDHKGYQSPTNFGPLILVYVGGQNND